MSRRHLSLAAFTLLTLVLASCKNEDKTPPNAAPPRAQRSITTQPGVAGGVREDVLTLQAVVSAVDVPARRVTLTDSDGNSYAFTASPEIKNLPQMHVGDKVTATFARRLVVLVRRDDAPPSLKEKSSGHTAVRGEKPGVLVAEESEMVARVIAMDPVNRTADLQFSDAAVKRVPVRSDVDMSRYHVGDSVIIRVTSALTVLVRSS